jgi:hypothetical protein
MEAMMATTWIKTPLELAETISAMRYGDLLEVAKALYEMNADDNAGLRDMNSKYGMADTLFDWAEATVEEAEEEAKTAKMASAKAA